MLVGMHPPHFPLDPPLSCLLLHTQMRGGASARPSVRGRRRSFLLDNCQNVTIDHSQADVINNTYTDALTACIAAGMQSGGGFPLQSVPFVNAALFKEQLSRQRYRITQSEPKVISSP